MQQVPQSFVSMPIALKSKVVVSAASKDSSIRRSSSTIWSHVPPVTLPMSSPVDAAGVNVWP